MIRIAILTTMVYWVMSLVQGYLVIRGLIGFNRKVPIGELWKDSSHKGLVRLSEEKCVIS